MSDQVVITRSRTEWMIVLAAAAETASRTYLSALAGMEDAAAGERAMNLTVHLNEMFAEVTGDGA